MPHARIAVRQGQQTITLIYRLPVRLLHPLAMIWSLVGGAAMGTGVALALVVSDVIAPGDGTAFRAALIGAALVVALALYGLVYLPAARCPALRVRFDEAAREVTIWPPARRRNPILLAARAVLGFRLDGTAERGSCTLLADRDDAPPLVLLVSHGPCDDPRADLPHFVDLLVAQLDRIKPRPKGPVWPRPVVAVESPMPDDLVDRHVPD